MKIKRIILYAAVMLAGTGLFAGGFVLARGWQGLAPPSLAAPGGVVGEWGPIGLVFSQPMEQQSVESHWHIDPAVKGSFRWGGSTLWFYPAQALTAGTEYHIVLASGVQSSGGKTSARDESWVVKVRAPEIVYLSPAGETSDLWAKPVNGGTARELSYGEIVYDFGVSYDGEQVAYSALNEQKGYDIWIVDRNGKNAREAADCGKARCTSPAWSSDGGILAYSRQEVNGSVLSATDTAHSQNGESGAGNAETGKPRIWTLDLATGKTNPLYSDPQITGSSPAWSPDGRKIAFIDEGAGGIRIMDLQTGKDVLVQAKTPVIGSWSQDSASLAYSDLDSSDLPSVGAAFEVTFPQGNNSLLFDKGPANSDYGAPVLSPDGRWFAVGVRFVEGPPSRQLWLLNQDGTRQKVISGDNLVTHGAYSWSPDGEALVFQQFSLGSSTATPDVVVWDLESSKFQTIANKAAQPRWLP